MHSHAQHSTLATVLQTTPSTFLTPTYSHVNDNGPQISNAQFDAYRETDQTKLTEQMMGTGECFDMGEVAAVVAVSQKTSPYETELKLVRPLVVCGGLHSQIGSGSG
jgi:hypothetical protein